MKSSLRYLVALDLAFLMLLVLSSATVGVLSEIIYYSAFVIPLLIYFFGCGTGKLPRPALSLRPKGRGLLLAIPVAPCLILSCIGLSLLFSYLFSLATGGGSQPLVGGFPELFLLHALLPSILEELLFRLVPLSLIAPYSKKSAVLISAILFAVIHIDLAKLPYAFLAGVVFATVDIVTESILPSVLLHLINNTLSIFCQWEKTAVGFALPMLLVLCVLSAIGAVLIIIMRKRYALSLRSAFSHDDKPRFHVELLLPIVFSLVLAVGSLIASI